MSIICQTWSVTYYLERCPSCLDTPSTWLKKMGQCIRMSNKSYHCLCQSNDFYRNCKSEISFIWTDDTFQDMYIFELRLHIIKDIQEKGIRISPGQEDATLSCTCCLCLTNVKSNNFSFSSSNVACCWLQY